MTTNTCTTCGGVLLTSSGQTFCPACLLQQGMKSSTYGAGPRVAWKPPEIERLTAAFPQLEIQQLLGVGGMGAVFKVRQKELDRVAALKVLPGEMAADAGFTERFLREARLLASLSHPHIVTVYEFGQRDGIYFLLMEFIDGVTLRQALRAEPIKKLASKETLAIVGQLCDALQFAHDEGVVHRDIKPENILIDKRGRVKIADFGLARLLGQSPTMPTLTGTHQLMGTPAYMAPEQIEGLPGIDHRADIYSIGVVFYELLTGELPLGRFSPPSERAETDVRLDEVVLRALAREPDRRYQQASQVKTDVEALRNPAIVSSLATDGPKKKHRVGLFVSAFALGALMTPFVFAAMWMVMEWRWAESNATHSEQLLAAREAAIRANALAAEEQRRIAIEASPATNATAPSSGGAMMSRTGVDNDSNTAEIFSEPVDEMPPILNTPPTNKPPMFDPVADARNGEPMVSDVDRSPFLPQGTFPSLTGEQREVVNEILKETHERYLKEEALHSIVSVDANGVQTTEISAFPDQLRAIENEMWTKLDDALPVELQKEFRVSLNRFGTSVQRVDGITEIQPGRLGWQMTHLPLKVRVSRSGRWFDWSVVSEKSNPGFISTVTELDQGNAPTLPSALQRYYREPGPWMAVANARATYAAKDWMKFADHFTASAMTREILNSMAFGDAIDVHLNEEGAAEDHQKRVMQEVARSPALSEMLGKAIVADGQGANGAELRLEDLIQQLQGASPDDVDAIIERATKGVPQETLRQVFAMWALGIAVIGEEVFEFDLVNGELSSYTKADDTASATLTIPRRKIPVTFLGKSPIELDDTFWADGPIPIRFKRENGQWRIDAIGSNERLLARLKHTKIWKQHAEIEAVLENARTAYAAKEWQKLADCFTQAGKYRWTLRTHSMMSTNASPLPEEEAKLRMEKYRAEIERLSLLQGDVGTIIDQHPLAEGYGRRRLLLDQFLWCPANESDAALTKFTETISETVVDSAFVSWTIQSAFLWPEVGHFDFDGWQITDVKPTEGIATANLVTKEGTPPMPVRFVEHDGQWKIDAIGTPEELQQQVRIALDRQNGDSPRAAVEAFREAMADGRFQTALNCMTEDVRNEWKGEMLVGCCHEADHLRASEFVSRYESSDLVDLGKHTGGQLTVLAGHLKAKLHPGASPLSTDERRSAVIELARLPQVPAQMLSAFLMVRLTHQPDLFAPAKIGEFEEVPLDRDGPEVMKYRLQPASPGQLPLELDIIQIDGLWKLNTIIDPALKPWPLPVEETMPQDEAAPPVDRQ